MIIWLTLVPSPTVTVLMFGYSLSSKFQLSRRIRILCSVNYLIFYQIQGLLGHQNDIVLCVIRVGWENWWLFCLQHTSWTLYNHSKAKHVRPCTYAMKRNGSINRGCPAKKTLSAMRIAWRLWAFLAGYPRYKHRLSKGMSFADKNYGNDG